MSSTFCYNDGYDLVARLLGIGIFAIENYTHMMSFHSEIMRIVSPALSPLPESVSSIVHAITIGLGLGGSLIFMISGLRPFKSYSGISLKALLVFMLLITWSWWFRRNGKFLWEVTDSIDRRNRTIHCLKNASIFGLLLMIYRESSKDRRKRS